MKRPKKLSESEARSLIARTRLIENIEAIPKPYAPEAWEALDQERQAKVLRAEVEAYLYVSSQTSLTRSRRHDGETVTEDALIDQPLAKMRALAHAYAESGLAGSDAEATQMADAYKGSIVRQSL